jgi:predicted nucleotidyltransferase
MSLLEFIKENENARLIFGQKEIEIIKKQLNNVNLKPSEKTRLSRDIRKKLEVIKKLSEFESEFELKKGADIKFMIKEAKDIILQSNFAPKIKRIFLFGSAAKNDMSFRSDIDIGVEFNEINLKEATQFRVYVSGKVSDRVDIQVLNILPAKIKETIINNNKVLYTHE